ncbi:MAG: rhodanese-like domain-containing protein [Planctomycetales bacterium]|nr:rhodanese-like domain-containing protein [Planctomycetales bacterium]
MSPEPSAPLEVDVNTVNQQVQRNDGSAILLDCRRADEWALNRIDTACWIPMDELPSRSGELPQNTGQPLVVYCHHGGRSLMVARWLRANGWPQAQSMTGGIDAWALQVDPQCPRY